jgi:2-phosphoglycerate kinase
MGNIRLIQEYLVRKADKYCVPRVDNSNVDRSVGIIHLTVMRCAPCYVTPCRVTPVV